jgi:hypothetical protein
MSADGSTIRVALSALFDFCVPALSGGRLEQTFPAELFRPLTENEEKQYADTIKDSAQSWKIASDDGVILLLFKEPYCSIVTADGDPTVARDQFRSRLAEAGGSEQPDETITKGYEQIHGMIPVGDEVFISVIFSAGAEKTSAGFYGSACLVRKNA